MSGFGDPDAVDAASDDLRRAATSAGDARALVQRARPRVWEGAAADAFLEAADATLDPAERLARTLASGSGTLARYAAAQREAASGFDDAQRDYDRAVKALRANPLDLPAGVDLVRSRFAAFGAVGRLQEAASTAAAELRAATGDEGDGRPWWDPWGWFNDPEDPDERVRDDILDDDAFDPEDVSQGQIGDCFMLSTVVSLLGTDAGDEFIREHIRWDADKQGYWVTLYVNGEAEEIFVEYVFDNGAKQNDWQFLFLGGDKPSIAALYESAIRQRLGYSAIDGGEPEDAMGWITGEYIVVQENDNYAGLQDWQVDNMRDTLADGGQVVISSPRSGDHRITVTDPAGNSRDIDIVNTHSYTVTRVEADGSVWMRNPWGNGNSADGGGEFRVSAEDVQDLFWRSTSTNINGS